MSNDNHGLVPVDESYSRIDEPTRVGQYIIHPSGRIADADTGHDISTVLTNGLWDGAGKPIPSYAVNNDSNPVTAVVEPSINQGEATMADGTNRKITTPGGGYSDVFVRDHHYQLTGAPAYSEAIRTKNIVDIYYEKQKSNGVLPTQVKQDGTPIYSSTYGDYCVDSVPFLISTIYEYWQRTGDISLFEDHVDDIEQSLDWLPLQDDLVYVDPNNVGLSYGFHDTVKVTGKVAMCSILMWRAYLQLAEMYTAIGEVSKSARYVSQAEATQSAFQETMYQPGGNFPSIRAATGTNDQPYVWASAFAVYTGIVTDSQAREIADGLLSVRNTYLDRGCIRHLTTTEGYWNSTTTSKDTYQNGGYWPVPLPWLCYALSEYADATQVAREILADAWQIIDAKTSPEWINTSSSTFNGSNYIASGTMADATSRPAESSLAFVRATLSANQSIGSGSTGVVTVAFDNIVEETPTGFFDTTNNQLVAPAAGEYKITSKLRLDALNDGSALEIRGFRNSTKVAQQNTYGSATSQIRDVPVVTWREELARGDSIHIEAFQNTGASQTIQSGAPNTFLEIEYLG